MAERYCSPSRRSSTRGAFTSTIPAPVMTWRCFGVAVAHHEPFARLVDQLGVGVQVGPALGQQRRWPASLGRPGGTARPGRSLWRRLPPRRGGVVY